MGAAMTENATAEREERASGSVLVLGGLGFIGSHISRYLLGRGYRIRVFDKLYASHSLVEDIADAIEITNGDIERAEDVWSAFKGMDFAVDLRAV